MDKAFVFLKKKSLSNELSMNFLFNPYGVYRIKADQLLQYSPRFSFSDVKCMVSF